LNTETVVAPAEQPAEQQDVNVRYTFLRKVPNDPDRRFEVGQVVRFSEEVPDDVVEELGHLLVVIDDDRDLIITTTKKGKRQSSIPASSDELLVICRVLQTGQRLEVSREILVFTGESLSYEVVEELMISWTGRGLGLLDHPLDHLMHVHG